MAAAPEQRRAAYTRIAAMISALVCSPDFLIDLGPDRVPVPGRKPVLEAIFELSGYEGPFHLLRYNGQRNADGSVTLRAATRFSCSPVLFTGRPCPAELMAGRAEAAAGPAAATDAGLVHARLSCTTHDGEKNRGILIEALRRQIESGQSRRRASSRR